MSYNTLLFKNVLTPSALVRWSKWQPGHKDLIVSHPSRGGAGREDCSIRMLLSPPHPPHPFPCSDLAAKGRHAVEGGREQHYDCSLYQKIISREWQGTCAAIPWQVPITHTNELHFYTMAERSKGNLCLYTASLVSRQLSWCNLCMFPHYVFLWPTDILTFITTSTHLSLNSFLIIRKQTRQLNTNSLKIRNTIILHIAFQTGSPMNHL